MDKIEIINNPKTTIHDDAIIIKFVFLMEYLIAKRNKIGMQNITPLVAEHNIARFEIIYAAKPMYLIFLDLSRISNDFL